MPLSDTDARKLFDDLAKALVEARLEWVVDQTQKQIDFGKFEEKSVAQLEEIARSFAGDVPVDVGSYEVRQKPGKPVKFSTTRPFTGTESVQLLVDAVSRAVEGLAAIESTIVSEFAELGFTGAIQFIDDGETEPAEELSIRDDRRQAAVDQLAEALSAVREIL